MKGKGKEIVLPSNFSAPNKKESALGNWASIKRFEENKDLKQKHMKKLLGKAGSNSGDTSENIVDDEEVQIEDEPKKPCQESEITKTAAGSNFIREPNELLSNRKEEIEEAEFDQDDIKEDRPL